jgi:hypothetical protein
MKEKKMNKTIRSMIMATTALVSLAAGAMDPDAVLGQLNDPDPQIHLQAAQMILEDPDGFQDQQQLQAAEVAVGVSGSLYASDLRPGMLDRAARIVVRAPESPVPARLKAMEIVMNGEESAERIEVALMIDRNPAIVAGNPELRKMAQLILNP